MIDDLDDLISRLNQPQPPDNFLGQKEQPDNPYRPNLPRTVEARRKNYLEMLNNGQNIQPDVKVAQPTVLVNENKPDVPVGIKFDPVNKQSEQDPAEQVPITGRTNGVAPDAMTGRAETLAAPPAETSNATVAIPVAGSQAEVQAPAPANVAPPAIPGLERLGSEIDNKARIAQNQEKKREDDVKVFDPEGPLENTDKNIVEQADETEPETIKNLKELNLTDASGSPLVADGEIGQEPAEVLPIPTVSVETPAQPAEAVPATPETTTVNPPSSKELPGSLAAIHKKVSNDRGGDVSRLFEVANAVNKQRHEAVDDKIGRGAGE